MKKRNMKKFIREGELWERLTLDDIAQIYEISLKDAKSTNDVIFNSIVNGLEAGYMWALADAKKKSTCGTRSAGKE